MAQDKGLTSLEKVMIAANAADDKKATDIVIQDVRDLIGVTDYFVIITAQNNRQISAVINAIEDDEIKLAGVKPLHVEGAREGFWSLMDFGDFVVHVFQPEGRDYYRLDEVWNDAPTVPFEPKPNPNAQ
ncbi:ribosome-associated protein [Slackia heliotrinireducens]|uniref:Ribosomal silencing factor RsfS n=1 Tax=Slackia heliotrinireducens (strain ATCC 29202 / DSM 20476 / NCTC 11029 / RHS 1) TaxID=471855 RepID=C7N5Z8_SLAHD|nr:ribosome silencing factor [Slackia heliotrinireducens]ACV22333.1 iojap-related protein [Slackia heliotrinireducens DSM 20476]VEH00568.1 ribosome-associated protein [Slackia heliotrinireducens]